MPLPAKLAAADRLYDPLGEGTGGDRPRVGAKAPARGADGRCPCCARAGLSGAI
jgi:hypothetical protein